MLLLCPRHANTHDKSTIMPVQPEYRKACVLFHSLYTLQLINFAFVAIASVSRCSLSLCHSLWLFPMLYNYDKNDVLVRPRIHCTHIHGWHTPMRGFATLMIVAWLKIDLVLIYQWDSRKEVHN